MPRFGFTEHAIDRFIERHAPDLSRKEARKCLEETALKAVRLKEKTINGESQWMLEDGIILVTKRDGGETVCVTILPEPYRRGPREEELEMMREYAEANLPPITGEKREKAPHPNELKQFMTSALSDKQLRKMLHIYRLDAAKEKQRQKTIRHLDHQAKEIEKMRTVSRISINALVSIDPNHPALEEIRAIEPIFLTQSFLLKRAS